jgi:hypothetical protein
LNNQAAALAALSKVALPKSPAIAAKLSLAAWPKAKPDPGPKLVMALAALGDAIVELRERRVFRGHDDPVNSAAFSPDGARVVTASNDKTARVWDVSTIPKGDIFHIACAWLPDHDLTDVARDYGLTNLTPICTGDPPLPDPPAPASPP